MREGLRTLIDAIIADDEIAFAAVLAASPDSARDSLRDGATRQHNRDFFIASIGRYLMTGDTALHIAAAAYRVAMVRRLLALGADPRARNRRGAAPLHAAAAGQPGSGNWDPQAQTQTIAVLIAAGADPNALDKGGTAPLHKAVRTRCAAAVDALIDGGAEPELKTRSGTTSMSLAELTTGRSGSGSPQARAEQAVIVKRLRAHITES